MAAKAKTSTTPKRTPITVNHVGGIKPQPVSKSRAVKKKVTPPPPVATKKKVVVKAEKLQPNPKVIVFDKDPTFETKLVFASSFYHNIYNSGSI